MGLDSVFQKSLEFSKEAESFVIVTLIAAKGSVPQEPGAKCIVTSKGLQAGTIGGGKVEAKAINCAQEILSSSQKTDPLRIEWNLQKDIGMTCGGVVEFLFEHFPGNPWPIAIFGAGHVSQALTRVLSKLQCQITVIDSRLEWLERLENVKTIHTENPEFALSHFNEKTFFLCMTKGHSFDVPFLEEIARRFPQAPYIGVIGSKTKALAIKRDLKELGVDDSFFERIKIPLGLPLGKDTPEEISISIAAELIQRRDSL